MAKTTESPATTTTAKEVTPKQILEQAVANHRDHHAEWMRDPRREDVDEAYMDSLFGIVEARLSLPHVRGVDSDRLDALTELIAAYHEHLVRIKRKRTGVLNRFWLAWRGVEAVW